MHDRKFDPSRLELLNRPARLRTLDPRAIWEELGVGKPYEVADIGAGTGFFAVRFAPLLAPGGRIWACDVAPAMVAWMQSNLPEAVRGTVIPRTVDESRIDLEDSSLELAYMINVYHELESPEATLRDIRRLLRPGGTIGIVDWRKTPTPEGPPVSHRVEEHEIIGSLQTAGFVRTRSSARLPYHSLVVANKPGTRDERDRIVP